MPTPAPVCVPPTTLNQNSFINVAVGDTFCIDTTCQWACVLNDCSSESSSTRACANVLNENLDSVWNAASLNMDQFIDVSFEQACNATGLIVIESKVGTGVKQIDVWDDVQQQLVPAWLGDFDNTGNRGVEYYLFNSTAVQQLVRRVRVYFGGFRYHDVQGLRLVGRIPGQVAPKPSGKRLPGIFERSQLTLRNARGGMVASYTPAPVIGDTVYVPPGFNSERFSTYVPEVDRCDLAAGKCTTFTGGLPSDTPRFQRATSAVLKVGTVDVLFVHGGIIRSGFSLYPNTFWFRTTTQTTWNEIEPVSPRHSGA